VRAFLFSVGVVAMCVAAIPLAAQWPGELRGVVVDVWTGRGISSATVTVLDGALQATTDSGGSFFIRGLSDGIVDVLVERLGYRSETRRLRVQNGRIFRLTVVLIPEPVELQELVTSVDPTSRQTGFILRRPDILRSGVRTLGEALRGRAGLVLRSDIPGGAETLSVRGSAAGAVLVLVDGSPLNDPLTGVADLSSVPVSSISSIEVRPGAQSTQFGPGARAGVVIVTTRSGGGSWNVASTFGSLGRRSVDGDFGLSWSGWSFATGGRGRWLEGAFQFEKPAAVGGGHSTRRNADLTQLGGWVSAEGEAKGGRLAVRVLADLEDRGLPGKSFIPSANARSNVKRGRASVAWRRARGSVGVEWVGFGHLTDISVSDQDPPLGRAFDDRSRVLGAGIRGKVSGKTGGAVANWWLGLITQAQWVDSATLSDAVPVRRTDASFSLGVQSAQFADSSTVAGVAIAVHRDPSGRPARLTHTLGLDWSRDRVRLSVKQRSSFSPPTLADQFFREGVAVTPNPDLKAELVPSELEVAMAASWAPGGWPLTIRAAAYDGDVRGMIIWAPDFRFVWSPRNTDVNRRGLDVTVNLSVPGKSGRLEISLAYGLADVTYRRKDPSQVAYRPRHSGALGLAFRTAVWTLSSNVVITGARFPVAAPTNELSAFPVTDLRVARTLSWRARRLELAVHVRRLLNRTDNLIFGFPHPGRTIDVSLRVQGLGIQ
jgi:vitamin B12 transporter